MPSWIREHEGIEWYDEAYTTKQTNQRPDQLHKKVAAGKLRSLNDARGVPAWYARPDVEQLRDAFLKRRKTALAWKPSDDQLEARHTRNWQSDVERELVAKSRQGPSGGGSRSGGIDSHIERVMLHDIAASEAERNKPKRQS